MNQTWLPLASLVLATSALATQARAADGASQPRVDAGADYVPTQDLLRPETVGRFELGYRGSFVTSQGYAPFSTDEFLPQLSLAATRTLFARGAASFAVGFAWDHGKSGATSRGDSASLTFNQLTVPLEARLQFRRWGYAFVRAAPGVAAIRTEVDDPSAPAALTQNRWLFAANLSGGYALPVWTRAVGPHEISRLWVQAEGGYGWIPSDSDDLSSGSAGASNVELQSVALRGGFFRLALATSL